MGPRSRRGGEKMERVWEGGDCSQSYGTGKGSGRGEYFPQKYNVGRLRMHCPNSKSPLKPEASTT